MSRLTTLILSDTRMRVRSLRSGLYRTCVRILILLACIRGYVQSLHLLPRNYVDFLHCGTGWGVAIFTYRQGRAASEAPRKRRGPSGRRPLAGQAYGADLASGTDGYPSCIGERVTRPENGKRALLVAI